MKIKVRLSIGLAGAVMEDTLLIDEEEFDPSMTREEYVDQVAEEWATNYIEISWREV